jgi:hypothetical protein
MKAKDTLERYCRSVKHTLNDERLKDTIQTTEQSAIKAKADEVGQWVATNPEPDISAF